MAIQTRSQNTQYTFIKYKWYFDYFVHFSSLTQCLLWEKYPISIFWRHQGEMILLLICQLSHRYPQGTAQCTGDHHSSTLMDSASSVMSSQLLSNHCTNVSTWGPGGWAGAGLGLLLPGQTITATVFVLAWLPIWEHQEDWLPPAEQQDQVITDCAAHVSGDRGCCT